MHEGEEVSVRMGVRFVATTLQSARPPYGESFRGRAISGRVNIDLPPASVPYCMCAPVYVCIPPTMSR